MFQSCRNQSIDLYFKSIHWFLHDGNNNPHWTKLEIKKIWEIIIKKQFPTKQIRYHAKHINELINQNNKTCI